MTTISPAATADAAILARVLGPERSDLKPEAARALLQLRLDRGDLDRLPRPHRPKPGRRAQRRRAC